MTRHEKTGLMYTKYTYSCYSSIFLITYITFSKSVSCMRFLINCCKKLCWILTVCSQRKVFNFKNVVKFYVRVRPIFSYRITNVHSYIRSATDWRYVRIKHVCKLIVSIAVWALGCKHLLHKGLYS